MTQEQAQGFIDKLSSAIQDSLSGLTIIGWESLEYKFEMELHDLTNIFWIESDKMPVAEGRCITRDEWREKRHALPYCFADDPSIQERHAKIMQKYLGDYDFTQRQPSPNIMENADEYRFYLKRPCRKCREKGIEPCDECIHTGFNDTCKKCGRLKKQIFKQVGLDDPLKECASCYGSGWIITNLALSYLGVAREEYIDIGNDPRIDLKKFDDIQVIRTALDRGDMTMEKLDFSYDRANMEHDAQVGRIWRSGIAKQRYRAKIPVAVATIAAGERKFEWVLYDREFDMINSDRIVREIFENLVYPAIEVKHTRI